MSTSSGSISPPRITGCIKSPKTNTPMKKSIGQMALLNDVGVGDGTPLS